MVNRPIPQILHGQKLLTMLPTGTVQQACQQMRAALWRGCGYRPEQAPYRDIHGP